MQKVLVAGSTGYLGRYVVRELKEKGYWVRALVRDPEPLKRVGHFLQPAVIDKIDDVFIGKVTEPDTLVGMCDDIDIVFSSVGITRQKDKVTYRDVDYQGNRNILDVASRKSVKKFIYVSVFKAHMFEHLSIVKAHEDFARDLKESGLDYAIIRTTGFFSDMSEFLKMAKSGRVYLIGSGDNKINPIHGADLAKICVDAINLKAHEIPFGGPVTYKLNEIAELALSIYGKESKTWHVPLWIAKAMAKVIKPFNKQMSDLAEFFIAGGQFDGVAPATGAHTLDAFYKELATFWQNENSKM